MKRFIVILSIMASFLTAVSCEPLSIDILPIEKEVNGNENIVNEDNIDCVPFTDPRFKDEMLAIADKNHDGKISKEEALTVTEIVLHNKGIKNIDGIDWFSNVWKVDLNGNDIKDATMIKGLHQLYWLDMANNPNLEEVDISGCTIYFEHIQLDEKKNVILTQYQEQFCESGNPNKIKAKIVEDNRQSTDFTDNYKLTKVKSHTKGSGHLAMVLAGSGYIDVDYKDGSFDRLLQKRLKYLKESDNIDNWEVYDIYYIKQIGPDRHHYYFQEEAMTLTHEVKLMTKFCYNALWPANIDEFTKIGNRYIKPISSLLSIDYENASFYEGVILFHILNMQHNTITSGAKYTDATDYNDDFGSCVLSYYTNSSTNPSGEMRIMYPMASMTQNIYELPFFTEKTKYLKEIAEIYKQYRDQFIHNPGLDDIELLK